MTDRRRKPQQEQEKDIMELFIPTKCRWVCENVCVCVTVEANTDICEFRRGREVGVDESGGKSLRLPAKQNCPLSSRAGHSNCLSPSLHLSVSSYLSSSSSLFPLTTHSNSLDEAASPLERVSFLPSCW